MKQWRIRTFLVAYDPVQQPVAKAAAWIAQELSADLVEIGNDNNLQADQYEFVLSGFSSQDGRLSTAVEDFLERFDFGARTIYPFVLDESAGFCLCYQCCIPLLCYLPVGAWRTDGKRCPDFHSGIHLRRTSPPGQEDCP